MQNVLGDGKKKSFREEDLPRVGEEAAFFWSSSFKETYFCQPSFFCLFSYWRYSLFLLALCGMQPISAKVFLLDCSMKVYQPLASRAFSITRFIFMVRSIGLCS
jgi:hypothetical protein